MREIKFRAWDKENEKWIPTNKMGFWEDGLLWYLEDYEKNEPPYFADRVNWVLMQYTGLNDINGVDIYEGDILTSKEYPFQDDGEYNYHGVVEWAEEEAAYYLTKRLVNKNRRGISDGISEMLGQEDVTSFEIIGNIYENPELLGDAD